MAKKLHLKNIGRGCPAAYFGGLKGFKYVEDHKKVTCLLCKRQIKLHNLKPRKEFEEIPKLKAEKWGDRAILTCPVCGRRNYHGWESGHRVSHCDCWENGYELICEE